MSIPIDPQAAGAVRALGEAGAMAAGEIDTLQQTLARSQGTLESFVRGVERGSGSMRTQWQRALREMVVELAHWMDAVQGAASTGGSGGSLAGTLGWLVGMAGESGRRHHVTFSHPTVERPAGAILPGALAALAQQERPPVQVTLAEGAVQITAGTVDERTLSRAADLLAERIHARLAFEDRRYGRG